MTELGVVAIPGEPWDAARAKQAALEASSWLGTPHRDRIAIKGKGVDCLNLMREFYVAGGILPRFRFPYYSTKLGIGLEFNVMEWAALELFFCRKLEGGEPPAFGDLVIFSVGGQSNHVGMMTEGGVVHASVDGGVRIDPMEELQGDLQSILRFTGIGVRRDPATVNLREQVKEAKRA